MAALAVVRRAMPGVLKYGNMQVTAHARWTATTVAMRPVGRASHTQRLLRPARHTAQRRWQSASAEQPWPIWQFKQVQELSQQHGSDTILIDVREPHEYVEGHIPTALNMPINSAPEGLFLSPEDFEERFGFPKPEAGTPVVFYCKAGIRSKGASIIASDAGLTNIREYRPSFDDWVANNGAIERGVSNVLVDRVAGGMAT